MTPERPKGSGSPGSPVSPKRRRGPEDGRDPGGPERPESGPGQGRRPRAGSGWRPREPGTGAGTPAGPRRRAVLDVLREAGAPLGVTDIAARIGVHPNTVRFHLDALVADGSVERSLDGPSGPGRPRTVYTPRQGMDRGGVRGYRLLAEILISRLATSGDGATEAAVEAGRVWGGFLVDQLPPFREPTGREATDRLTDLLADLGFAPEAEYAPGRTAVSGTTATPGTAVTGKTAGTGTAGGAGSGADGTAGGAGRPDGTGGAGGMAGTGGTGRTRDPGGKQGDTPPERIRLRHCPFLELAEEYSEVVCPLHLGLMRGALAELRAPVRVTRLEPFAEPGACLAHLVPGRRETPRPR